MSQERSPPTIFLLILTCLFAAVCFGGLCAYVLWDARQDRVERAHTSSQNLVHVLASDIRRTFELYDLSLRGAIEGIGYPDLNSLPPAARQQFLFDRSATATYMNAILVLDATGQILYDSTTLTPRTLNASDRDYFKVHQTDPDVGLYVSKPTKSRLSGEWVVLLSRRYNLPDGSFGGVAVASLALEYFSSLFDRLVMSEQSTMTVFRSDGTLMMRRPYRFDMVGKDMSATPLFSHYSPNLSGTFSATGLDNISRDYAFSPVANLPLVVSVGLTKDEILGDWGQKALLLGFALLLFCTVLALLMAVLTKALRKRDLLEQELTRAVLRDPLTGVGNRRAFTERMQMEWRDALRRQEPLSLLMVDVDHFKSFNDLLGHQEGDRVLQAVARAIDAKCRRPHDFVARFGGEEFVVILPNTDSKGARVVAEAMRASVLDLLIDHAASAHRQLTISIGIGCRNTSDDDAEAIIRRADEALYKAKLSGRNKICDQSIEAPRRRVVA